MASLLDTDYLWVVGAIAARIAEQVPELEIEPVEELTQAVERGVRTSTAFVLWEGEKFPDDARKGLSQMVAQTFTVLLAVRNADQVNRDARNVTAGPLLARLHTALSGWAPAGAGRALKRASSMRRPAYLANQALYPLTFELLLTL